jgi:mitochondrial-processing peptidase subunit alpha
VRNSIAFELEDLNTRMDPEPLLTEMIHTAAYREGPLANSKLCPPENIEKINASDMYAFSKTLYKPNRTVLACVGTDHNEFIDIAKDKFNSVIPIWDEDTKLLGEYENNDIEIDSRRPIWHGGSNLIEKDLSNLTVGYNNQLPELTHLVVALESAPFTNETDFVASCVINTMMGGGGSFSAGGPGKGMYSRLYLNVLNKHHFMFR